MSSNKTYNKFTADELRLLLNQYKTLDDDYAEMQIDLQKDKVALQKLDIPITPWANHYEKPFIDMIAEFAVIYELSDDLKTIAQSDKPVQAQQEWIDGYLPKIDGLLDEAFVDATKEEKVQFVYLSLTYTMAMIKSLRCIMVYGHYMHDLLQLAKTAKTKVLKDKALFQAIRIDQSVVSLPFVASRISEAVHFEDEKFFNKLKNAITGKLGIREEKNFQKIRYVLQVLHESGGINQNDEDLKELFVKELNLYSDSQSTSEKNLKEFAYNFKKQKSTI